MKITIVTPSFNQLEFLKRNVASVKSQVSQMASDICPRSSVLGLPSSVFGPLTADYQVEHLIIDGGSTDGSAEWLERYAQEVRDQKTEVEGLRSEDRNQTTEPSAIGGSAEGRKAESLTPNAYSFSFVSEKDEGQTDAINKGLRKATGEIIGWLNSDDIYFPDAFEKVIRAFEKHPEADVIYSNGVWVDEHDQVVWRRRNAPFHFKTWLYGMADPFQPETFYRRRVLEKGGYLDKTFFMMMDREWWMRLAVSGCKFVYINDEFAALRRYGETKSAKFQDRNDAERKRLHDKYWVGFRFKNPRLQHLHWKALHIFYLSLRRVRILIDRMAHRASA